MQGKTCKQCGIVLEPLQECSTTKQNCYNLMKFYDKFYKKHNT